MTAIDTRPGANTSRTGTKTTSVFIFDQENAKVVSKEVKIREIQGNLIEVIEGIKEGDVLVVAGVPFLEDGQKVTQWKQKYRSPETDK